jgi:hypothetical protein
MRSGKGSFDSQALKPSSHAPNKFEGRALPQGQHWHQRCTPGRIGLSILGLISYFDEPLGMRSPAFRSPNRPGRGWRDELLIE